MTINWPVTPSVGTRVTGPRGEVWEWDGHKWVSVGGAPAGPQQGNTRYVGGNLQYWDGSAWQTIQIGGGGGPQLGVTDGSEAAPGHIGEIITKSDVSPSFTGWEFDQSLNWPNSWWVLPAGDWDISGYFWIGGLEPPAFVDVMLDNFCVMVDAFPVLSSPADSYSVSIVAQMFSNVTVVAPIYGIDGAEVYLVIPTFRAKNNPSRNQVGVDFSFFAPLSGGTSCAIYLRARRMR